MVITRAEKAAYDDYIKVYKVEIDEIQKRIKELENKKRKMRNIICYFNIEILFESLEVFKLYIKMSDASLEMLHIKNEGFLNNARKEVYKILQLLEDIVGNEIDRSLKDNEVNLKKINRVNPRQILTIVQTLHNTVSIVIDKLGEGSKWKWSYVDLQGRAAVINKNIINFTDLHKFRDPRTEFYSERQELLRLCKKNLSEAAKQYRNRYEISTKVPGDIIKSIEFLSSLRKINVILGEVEEANKLKNTIEALRVRMEAEEKKSEKKKKKS